MKTLLLCILLFGISLASTLAQAVGASPANKEVRSIITMMDQHNDDLSAIIKADASGSSFNCALWFMGKNHHFSFMFHALDDEICAWTVLDNSARAQVQAIFEHTRQLIEDDLQTTIPTASSTAASAQSNSLATETAQNKADYRKIQSWIASFRFKLTDPH